MLARDGIAHHLGIDVARMRVGPVEPEPLGHVDDDRPVLARLPGSGAPCGHLHLAVGVGDGAVLLRPCRCRPDHVGVFRRLGQEDVLDDEVLELGEGLARMLHVRVRHRRVLAHDVHAADRVGVHRVHDLDHREAALGIELRPPQLLVEAAHLRILDRLVVGEEHRDQAGVGRALHVVLAAQRCRPVPGRPIWPVERASAIRQRVLSVPWMCWLTPMPQKMIAASARA